MLGQIDPPLPPQQQPPLPQYTSIPIAWTAEQTTKPLANAEYAEVVEDDDEDDEVGYVVRCFDCGGVVPVERSRRATVQTGESSSRWSTWEWFGANRGWLGSGRSRSYGRVDLCVSCYSRRRGWSLLRSCFSLATSLIFFGAVAYFVVVNWDNLTRTLRHP